MALPEGEFSSEIRDFVSICLQQKPANRQSCAELLEHPFVKNYEKVDPSYLMKWIRTVK